MSIDNKASVLFTKSRKGLNLKNYFEKKNLLIKLFCFSNAKELLDFASEKVSNFRRSAAGKYLFHYFLF